MSAERVSLAEIVAEESKGASGKELTPLQAVGFKLALMVLILITLITGAVLWLSFRDTPALPALPSQLETTKIQETKQLLELYQQIAKGQSDRAYALFQLFVATTFLPIFTSILGYIFGSRGGRGSPPTDE